MELRLLFYANRFESCVCSFMHVKVVFYGSRFPPLDTFTFIRLFYPKRLTLHSGYTFCQYVCSLGIEPMTFCAANAMLNHWATGTLLKIQNKKGISDFLSHNSDFFSSNSEFFYQNCVPQTRNCELKVITVRYKLTILRNKVRTVRLKIHNSAFFSQHCEFILRNPDFTTHNCEFISHKSEKNLTKLLIYKLAIKKKKVRIVSFYLAIVTFYFAILYNSQLQIYSSQICEKQVRIEHFCLLLFSGGNGLP